jgi:hypothetical protein
MGLCCITSLSLVNQTNSLREVILILEFMMDYASMQGGIQIKEV